MLQFIDSSRRINFSNMILNNSRMNLKLTWFDFKLYFTLHHHQILPDTLLLATRRGDLIKYKIFFENLKEILAFFLSVLSSLPTLSLHRSLLFYSRLSTFSSLLLSPINILLSSTPPINILLSSTLSYQHSPLFYSPYQHSPLFYSLLSTFSSLLLSPINILLSSTPPINILLSSTLP